ncbi:hypothetical protein KO488_06265 [Poseidonibacter lekithochrous]|uniref:hypothetical protein n=1 Tax=Poseidonibacter TaxID=2321187 RepID=UPI001C092508|nr:MULTISPECIES: hypothetical protein [Poseidonibacter]MBU3014355.1 hypothetical protein [Poseidonibacter lekithochrous]MDO6827653.1 hypothetical protein [Poseidonibacter sp. 1_MG-2023]
MELISTLKKVFNFVKETSEKVVEQQEERTEKFSKYNDEKLLEMVESKDGISSRYAAKELLNRGYSEETLKIMMRKE